MAHRGAAATAMSTALCLSPADGAEAGAGGEGADVAAWADAVRACAYAVGFVVRHGSDDWQRLLVRCPGTRGAPLPGTPCARWSPSR